MKTDELKVIANELGEIVCAEKFKNYTIISNAINKQAIVYLSLDKIENHKLGKNLLRVHKSNLININQVIEIIEFSVSCQVKLTNGKLFTVSRRKKKNLIKQLNLP